MVLDPGAMPKSLDLVQTAFASFRVLVLCMGVSNSANVLSKAFVPFVQAAAPVRSAFPDSDARVSRKCALAVKLLFLQEYQCRLLNVATENTSISPVIK